MEKCSFGDFITKEYGLLKQILSYLPITDLRIAKKVCKAWCSAIEALGDKNPTTLIFETGKCVIGRDLPKPILSSVIIYQNSASPSTDCFETCRTCKKALALCPCMCSDQNTVFVSLRCLPYENMADYNSFWESTSALLMPSSEKCKVSTFYKDWKSPFFKKTVGDDVISCCAGLSHCVDDEPIKGLLILSKSNYVATFNWVNKLCNAMYHRQQLPFAVGGGISNKTVLKKGFLKENKWENPGVILIAFRGEAVSVLSDVLTSNVQGEINIFMEEMAERAGPVPRGGSRVAFIAQCVDRIDNTLDKWESEAFHKAFPAVPQFGFQAFGEYGIRSDSPREPDEEPSHKRKKLNFEHVHTTSFLIVTFSKI